MKANFEKAWERFDINGDGFIRAEETHTFMRSLMGKLNKFALAPGSLSDIGSGSESASVKAATETKKVEKKAPAPKKPAPKKEEPAEDADAEAVATDADNAAADDTNLEMDM